MRKARGEQSGPQLHQHPTLQRRLSTSLECQLQTYLTSLDLVLSTRLEGREQPGQLLLDVPPLRRSVNGKGKTQIPLGECIRATGLRRDFGTVRTIDQISYMSGVVGTCENLSHRKFAPHQLTSFQIELRWESLRRGASSLLIKAFR
jgi:hypothetical protein